MKSTFAWAIMVALAAPAAAAPAAGAYRDEFFWLGEINKASTVMLVEQGVVARPLGQSIASAIDKVCCRRPKIDPSVRVVPIEI